MRIYQQRGVLDWNTYAIVVAIELARGEGENPAVPEWLKQDYLQAIRDLAQTGAAEVLKATNPEDIRAILSIPAIAAGVRTQAKFLINYSSEELLEMEKLVRHLPDLAVDAVPRRVLNDTRCDASGFLQRLDNQRILRMASTLHPHHQRFLI